MLFPCAALFFLFTTLVAAAPTKKLQPDSKHFEKNIDFLTAAGGVWDVVSRPTSTGMPLQLISQLKFTVEDNREMPGGKDLMVTKYFQPQGHYRPTSGRWAHFDPSLPISGIWERKATGSKIKIFLELLKAAQLGGEQYPHSYYDMEGHYYFFHMITLGTGEGVESAKENEGGEGGSAKGGE